MKFPRLEGAALAAEMTALAQARQGLRLLLAQPAARAPDLAQVRDLEIPGAGEPLRARYYEASRVGADPLLVYFHGGGFVCCDIDTHDGIASYLAQASNGRVLSVGYRLAPETRFPGQLEDARAACTWALQNAAPRFGASPAAIAVGGDSAGAYLAATCAAEMNAQAPGAVALQALLYPLVHIEDSVWAEEEIRNFRFMGRLAALYITRSLAAEKFPSLLDLDLTHAPTTIIAGGGPMDPVRADVKAFAEALRGAGVRVHEKKYPVLMHGGLNFTAHSKTAVAALQEVGALIAREFRSPA